MNNKQLIAVLSQAVKEHRNEIIRQVKSTNKLKSVQDDLENLIFSFEKKIKEGKQIEIRADLSGLNQFYEEKTAENIENINKRLNVPNFSVYVWISSLAMLFVSALFIWFSIQSKQSIITDYQNELLKNNAVISRGDNLLFEDMHRFFKANPKNREVFINWRKKNRN